VDLHGERVLKYRKKNESSQGYDEEKDNQRALGKETNRIQRERNTALKPL